MTSGQITASDIKNWNSLNDIAASFEKRGLKPHPEISEDGRLVLELADGEFIELVEASTGKSATDYKPESVTRHTNLVSTGDYETFTFVTRVRDWDAHGRIKYQQFSFAKEQFRSNSGEKNTVLQKLNEIEYGKSAAVMDDLYDTRQIVKEFYEQFESLRTDLVQEVSGIPDDRGDAKGRYVQILLDRMIFLYFIQEKNLLDYDAKYLHDHHARVVNEDGDVYSDFYDPLFFDLLAEGKNDPEFGKLPYLNGGLFSKNPIEEEFDDAKLGEDADETNALFGRILDFLSDWNWNVDERLDIVDPKNLSPAVLGHIFEQTVNQKEMGAYYTPEEITGFMARQTIHPYLLDQLNKAEGTSYESIDDVFSLSEPNAGERVEQQALADGGVLAHKVNAGAIEQTHVETLYFDVLKDVRVLDPAVGSGAFLLAAQEVLLDVYLQCIEYFVEKEETEPWELTSRIKDEIDTIRDANGTVTLYAKREVILNNLYGVDIDEGAVEICKLRLWLSMVADIEDEPSEVEPLPNIDFNIRQGNSLIGQVDAVIESNDDGDSELDAWERKARFEDVKEAIQNHKSAESSAEARKWRKEAEARIDEHREKFDDILRGEFQDAGFDNITVDELRDWSPFHWPLEFAGVFEEGGFDVFIGNPPWDMLYANRDDFFIRYDEKFRIYPSEEKDDVMDELLSDPDIAGEWEAYQDSMDTRADFFTKGDTYRLQSPVVGGRTMPTKNELSALFLERVFRLSRDGVKVSLLLPGTIFGGVMGKDLRTHLLDNTNVENLIGFENKGIFTAIHDQYRFAILTFRYGGRTSELRGIFNQHDMDVVYRIEEETASIPRDVLTSYSPEGGIFPSITSQQEVSVLENVVNHPPLVDDIEDAWTVDMLTKEFVESTDKDRLQNSPEGADYPIYGGKNIHQFEHDNTHTKSLDGPKYWSRGLDDPANSAQYRVREKNFNRGHLKREIYEAFGGPETSKSQVQFVDDLLEEHRGHGLEEEDVLLDCSEFRIGIRDVSQSRNERTIIATVLLKEIICLHTINTFKPFAIEPKEEHLSESPLRSPYVRRFKDRELFAATGLLNSVVFDFLMRTKVETHIVKRELLESQMPRLTAGEDYFEYISERAARLNCYGERFAEMRERLGGIEPATDETERRRLQAEMDAAAFHTYGLDRPDTKFVLDDFHRVQNPRLMTEEYFDLVLEKYDELAESGPYP